MKSSNSLSALGWVICFVCFCHFFDLSSVGAYVQPSKSGPEVIVINKDEEHREKRIKLSEREIHEELEKKLGEEEPPQSDCDATLVQRIRAAVNMKQSIVERLKGNPAFENPEILGNCCTFLFVLSSYNHGLL